MNKLKIQEFLQNNHGRAFSTDYLHGYFDVPIAEVEWICDELIAEGTVRRPEFTQYVVGIAVDWNAVHEGRAERPMWARA